LIHVLAYDLKQPNDTPEDYQRVIAAIKSEFSSWCHVEQSVWVIDTWMDAGQARDHMKQFLNPRDVCFVARLQGNWGSWNFGDERNRWLKAQKF
jgi:hypothetical protein